MKSGKSIQRHFANSPDPHFQLEERIKELNCLYGIIDSLQTPRPDIDMEKVLQDVVSIIPDGFRIPEKTTVFLKIGDDEWSTPQFQTTERDLVSTLTLQDGKELELRAGLTADHDRSPLFLPEEEWLLNKISGLISRFYSHYLTVLALADREELFRTTLYSIGDAVITTDCSGNIQQMNGMAEQLTGWKESEVTGSHVSKVFHIINENSRQTIENPVQKVLENGQIVALANHTLLITKNQTEIPIADSGAPIRSRSGEVTGVVLVFRDQLQERTDRQKLIESESRYRSLFENKHTVMYIVDPETLELVDVNPAAVEFYGWSRAEMQKMKLSDINSLSRKEIEKVLDSALGRNKNYFQLQHRLKDGTVRDVEVYNGPISIGEKKYIYSIIIDVTERLRYERLVKDNLKEKDVLLAEIHHRVKNNMAVISGLLKLESESHDIPELQEILKKTDNRISSMALIHEKLYQAESLSEIEFSSYIKELAGHISDSFKIQRNVDITFDTEAIPLDITKAVPCGIILNELLTNGFKYAFEPDQPGRIHLKLNRQDEYICITYRDNGCGFDPSFLDTFENGGLKTLGFELIAGLTRQIRGDLEVQNDNGALVVITFPDV